MCLDSTSTRAKAGNAGTTAIFPNPHRKSPLDYFRELLTSGLAKLSRRRILEPEDASLRLAEVALRVTPPAGGRDLGRRAVRALRA